MKPFAFTLVAIWLLFPFSSHAQINDCSDAVVVCSDEDLAFNPDGPGLNDFADPDNHPGCITSLEQNSAWYYFQIDPNAPPGLFIGFIIHPNGGYGEDYDWALFGPNVDCGDLGFPIRCSSSAFYCGFCPETGMGMGATDFTEGPGTGDGFVMILQVEPGQGFYLLIDNWLGTMDGFVLSWTESAAPYLNCAAKPPCSVNAIAGSDISACEGDDVPLNGESTGTHGGETYSWSGTNGGTAFLSDPNIANPTINLPGGFTGIITYTLTVQEDTCIGEDQLDLIVNPLPVVNINPIGPFCQNESPQVLSATPVGGTWGGDATGNTFNPMTNGPGIHTVTYTYTDGNNCTTTEFLDIEVYALPDVSIDPDPADFCDSENSILLTATGNGGAGGFSYLWNTPSGMDVGSTYDATLSGVYTVTITDANGCTNSSVTTVTSHPNPDVEIIDPGPICVSLEVLTLAAVPPGGTFSGSIIDPSGELFPNMNLPGTYAVSYTYSDNNNCESTDFENITIIPIPNAFPDNNGPVCEGQPVLLFGETDGTGSTISYLWSGPNGYTSNMQNPTDATLGGAYVLQVIVDGCPSLPEVTNVVVNATPDAVALNDGPYCSGETIQLLGSTNATGNNITYAWSGPNGYTSDVQSPSDATEAGIYSLIISAGNCASPIAQTEVIFNAPPDAVATNNGPYCTGDAIALFGSTTTPGSLISFTWTGPNGYQSFDQNPTDAVATGQYQLIVEVDGCLSAPATTQVTINSLPQPVITGQNVFCTGFSATIDAGAGYLQYVWSNASQNQTLEVFSSGTYMVTVTDNNGCTGVAAFDVTELASLAPVITGNLEFCEGSGTILDAGTGYTSYVWSTGEISQTIGVIDEGNYGVMVTDADGCSGSAIVTTTVHPNPVVTIGGSSTYCIGGYTILDAGAGYAMYHWSNDSIAQFITVSSPGIYSVDVIDIFGCAGSASVTVAESTSLSPVITGTPAFCENGSTTLNAGFGFATYLWSDGSNSQNLTVTAAGIYEVTVSDNQGCSGSSSVSIMEVLPPSAVLQPEATLCNTMAGGSIINLYDLILSGDMGGSWEDADHSGAAGWFDNLNFNNIPAGDYHFIYTTNSAVAPCPEASYPVVVTLMDCACPEVLFFNANPLCNADGVLDLASIENTSEPGTWSITQSPAGSQPATLIDKLFDATASDPGDYTLQFSLQNQPPPGCVSDFQVIVHVDPAVDAGIALAPAAYCDKDDALINLSTLITGANPNGTWTETSPQPSQGAAFNPASGTFATGNQNPGEYIFQYALSSPGICPDDATEVSVFINPLPVVMVANPSILNCANPVQSLDASGSSSRPEYDITWAGPGILADGNEHTLHPTIDQAGTYLLTITNTLTGCINSASVTVTANTAPPTGALISSQDPYCFGDQDGFITIDQVIGGMPPYLYNLNNEPYSSTTSYNQLSAGEYTLGLEDANGCRWDTLISLVEPPEINLNLGPDIEIGLGENAIVQAIVNLPADQIDTLIWSPDDVIECIDLSCLEVIVHTFNSITLRATVVDEYGCQASDDLIITLSKNRRIYIPTLFSPNGDGINDIFYISGDGDQIVKIRKFIVFNRWGEVLHEALDFLPNDPVKGWDGHFKNQSLNPGVFVYFAEVEYIDGFVEQIHGDVTLMR